MPSRRAGPAPSLAAVLAAREARAARRAVALAARPIPLVSVAVAMPGPVKDCELSRTLHAAALAALAETFAARGWTAETLHAALPETGPEALVAVAADATEIKRATVALEESHPLGRIWDLDVTAPGGDAISRRDLGLPPRRCFVCDRPAHACARSRAHPIGDLVAAIEAIVDAWAAHA